MNLSYRILDCDIFESYMALEGWDNFPLLQSYTTQGEFPFLLKDNKYMIFDYTPSGGFLKAVCIYKMIGDTLIIDFFEVNKNYRHQGLGTRAMERLMLETGAKIIRDKTVIVIAHRLSSIKKADKICVLKAGTVIAQGTHEELIASSAEYQKLWQASNAAAEWKI